MILLLGLAFALRTLLLNGPRFHTDEALFASFARSIAVWRDPLLVAAPVDKPPLLFYLQALCYPLQGPVEMAARLPNLFASQITVALTFAAVKNLLRLSSGNRPASGIPSAVAAGLVALSPLAVAFSSTAFTDPLMVMWGMAAVVAAGMGRPGWSGLWLGLGMATKYQAVFFIPLVAGILWLAWGWGWWAWRRFGVGILGPIAIVLLWDWVRAGQFALLSTQVRGYGGIQFASVSELSGRWLEWVKLGRYLTGSPALNVCLLMAVLVVNFSLLVRRSGLQRHATVWLLSSWLLGYFLLHWVLDVQVWDRYLLPAVPILALLAGLLVHENRAWVQNTSPKLRRALCFAMLALVCVLAVSLFPNAILAAVGELPIGGDHGQYDGIEQVTDFLDSYPYGTVLYDHWASWHLRYYLFDSRVYVSWFAEPAALVDNLQVFGTHPSKFLLMPTWESFQPIEQALEAVGLIPEPAFRASRPDGSVSFIVYRITE